MSNGDAAWFEMDAVKCRRRLVLGMTLLSSYWFPVSCNKDWGEGFAGISVLDLDRLKQNKGSPHALNTWTLFRQFCNCGYEGMRLKVLSYF